MTAAQGKGDAKPGAARRFREVHYHRYPLGARSNIHGACLLRSCLPVRLPRPHTMQMIYTHPPPGVGHRRGMLPQWQEARDQGAFVRLAQEHASSAIRDIKDERRRVAQWLAEGRANVRTHVIVATQLGLLFFVAGFGYWNVLDINLGLKNEACVGVKAFEVCVAKNAAEPETEDNGDSSESIDQHELPVLIVALTTYVKRSNEAKNSEYDESGSYRLYALGADSLPPLSSEFIEKHALRKDGSNDAAEPGHNAARQQIASAAAAAAAARASSQPVSSSAFEATADPRRCASENMAEANGEAEQLQQEQQAQANMIWDLPLNSYAYLEERLFSLPADGSKHSLELDYLPFRISQDVVEGMPPVLLVAGNDNRVHRYALGRGQIIEIEPLLCPKTDVPLTFTAFDARVIGNYHVQVTAHQEFAVALQASRALTEEEAREAASTPELANSNPALLRRLLVADEEIYDAAPVVLTIFTPDSTYADRTAFDYAITHQLSTSPTANSRKLAAGDIYNAEWPIGTMKNYPRQEIDAAAADSEQHPRVHVLVGFVGEEAIIYHDAPIAGLDPVPTLVGGVAGRVPVGASHISGRLGGRGGVFSLPGSAKEGLITSVHFDDLDFDGGKEVIVGTVSGSVLIYKYVAEHGYVLVWKRRFPAPAYGIFSADINCDGANELVVVTLLGVHIMQPNLAQARAKLLRQLVLAAESYKKQDDTSDNAKTHDVEVSSNANSE
ncbi:hypothetical protein IWW36_002441 [Coemansia brasiliensis]|uniref:Uncharacterized protein n=1 Tax=Coemansia brasiliensis TaxID=2650707 RepID=A0A9W8M0N0_9FUNG|nr:hypothetical protein IWW36_002441 [Coemansia brasiliensis]